MFRADITRARAELVPELDKKRIGLRRIGSRDFRAEES